MQRSGQQCQQQPIDGAAHSHTESVDASSASNAQPSAAEPASSPATTTTTSVQAWRILKDSPYHFLTSQWSYGSWRLDDVDRKKVGDCPAQCSDNEKVLFAAHQLFGIAADWWETDRNSHQNIGAITWNEFKARFRTHYVPRGTLNLKKKEFFDMRQGSMTVNEYLNRFTQLSWYAPDDVNTDENKIDALLYGHEIQFQLLNTDYEDFQRMVDKAINMDSGGLIFRWEGISLIWTGETFMAQLQPSKDAP
jgi:hypothetical protein